MLTKFGDAVQMIPRLKVRILPTTGRLVIRATEISKHHGFLSNDALALAVMERQSITCIATHDSDFDCVPSIKRFSPGLS